MFSFVEVDLMPFVKTPSESKMVFVHLNQVVHLEQKVFDFCIVLILKNVTYSQSEEAETPHWQ